MKYTIDEKDRVVSIEGPWDSFMAGRAHQSTKDYILQESKNIWSYFEGFETISIYRQIVNMVRLTNKATKIPFRCDSPEARREMEMEIRPSDDGLITFETTLVGEWERPQEVTLFGSVSRRNQSIIEVCSFCKRFRLASGFWVEADDYVRETRFLEETSLPRLKERVCEQCSSLASSTNYILTSSGNLEPLKSVPLVIFLHGEGQHDGVFRLYAPPRLVANDQILETDSFILASLIKRGSGPWKIDSITQLLDEILSTYPIDRRRIYLTGVSSGGVAVWRLLKVYHNIFAGGVICAALSSTFNFKQVDPNAAIWCTLSAGDPIIPQKMFLDQMAKAGKDIKNLKFTLFSRGGHDCWSQTFSEPKIWKWLFEKRLN